MKRLPIAFVVALLVVIASAPPAFGAVLVSPSKVEVTLAPGTKGSFDIAVIDKGTTPMLVRAAAWDFARDASGRPRPVTAAEAATFYGCASWLGVTTATLEAQPNKQATIHVEVQAPADAKVGTYHCYLRALARPKVAKGSMPITYDISALILLTVAPPGSVGAPVSEIPQLRQTADVLRPQVKSYVFTSPITLRTTLVNTGNVHVNVRGHYEVFNGSRRVARLKAHEFTLLPGDRYPITDQWAQMPLFGRMKVRFVMDEGLDKPISAEQPFIFISSAALISVGASLGLVLAGTGAAVAYSKSRSSGRHAKPVVRKGRHSKGSWAPENMT